MECSCLKYYSLLQHKTLPTFFCHRDKCPKITTFSNSLLKKKTHLHLNGYFNPATKTSKNFLYCGVTSVDVPTDEHVKNEKEGIGIVSFLTGKNFLITGATGFLGKVLTEKNLRTNPHVGKIYVVIKAKDESAAKDRLIKEILNMELFRSLHAIHGENYQAFMLKKIVPLAGDLTKTNIGIKPEIAEEIAEEVDVLLNSAATTNFRGRYDVALDINTLGPLRLMSFARKMKRLKLFLHVSTCQDWTS